MFFKLLEKIFTKLREQTPLRWLIQLVFVFFGLFVLYWCLFYWIENVSWGEALWQAWQTFTTVGYGNHPAITVWGRVITMVLSTIGIAVLGGVFSAAFDYRNYLIEKRELGLMKNPFKDGYVMFNFPELYQGANFIHELRTVERHVGICIVDNEMEKLPESIAILPNIHFIKGSTLDKNTYQRAGITSNKAVIIFPSEASMAESDGITKTIVDLVTKFVLSEEKCTTRIVHILADPRNAWMFQDAYSTQVSERFELLAVVQELQDQYSAEIVETLLSNTRGANLKTVFPTVIIGWTWEKLTRKCIEVSKTTKIHCNPLALIKNGENDACPFWDTVIEEGDCISIIAFNDFKWKKFEKALAQADN